MRGSVAVTYTICEEKQNNVTGRHKKSSLISIVYPSRLEAALVVILPFLLL